MHKIKNIDDENIKLDVYQISDDLDRFIEEIYTEEQINQVLKAKENNIYLFLDDTFTNEELRNIRLLLAERKIGIFIDKYSKRKINDEIQTIDYEVFYSNVTNIITVKINSDVDDDWYPSQIFIYEINKMKKRKENTLFKKITSDIYKSHYPIEEQNIKDFLNGNEIRHIKDILIRSSRKLDADLMEIQHRAMKNGLPYNCGYKIIEIKELQSLINSCLNNFLSEEKLSEEEIILMNKLIDRNKYNIFLNKKYKTKEI